MTKEELEKEAKYYAEENKMNLIDYHDGIGLEEAYIAGAEPREKRIAELKAQIEKMKCCSNCDNWNWKHSKCEKKLKGDCFKQSKWILRR